MPFIEIGRLAERAPRPGWHGRFFHSEHMTFAHYSIEPGSDVHPHTHPQEEVWIIIDGQVEMTVDGETRLMAAGEAAVIPSGTEHSARTANGSKVIVVDYPLRDSVGGVSTL